jgi:glycosyltransferase involved in cell wall biosynthesis
MLNVCVLLDAFDHVSGISTTYHSQLHLAPSAGVRLTVIAPAAHGEAPRTDSVGGSALVRVGSRLSVHFPVDKSIRLDLPDREQFQRAVAHAEPDIVHIAAPGPVGLMGKRIARDFGVPLVGYFHTDYLSMQTPQVLRAMLPNPIIRYSASSVMQAFNRITERMVYAPCDIVCCEAHKVADAIIARGLHPRPIHVPATLRHDLPNAIQTADPDVFARRFKLPPDRPSVLYVGRFSADKNLPLIAQLAQRCPDVHFIAVGDGVLRHLIEHQPNITLTGWLNGADLWSAFAASTVFLMPSWNETFGLVALEAMAMGIPVLTADTAGSAPDVLAAGAGIAFDVSDIDAAVFSLRAMLADTAALAAMRSCGLGWFVENHPTARYRQFVQLAYHPVLETTFNVMDSV